MGQQGFRVKWSLGTKLLGSVTAILALAVAFLTVSSIVLLKKDKIAYVYDAQATTCTLTGREFAVIAQSGLDLVQHALSTVDPLKKAAPDAGSRVQFLLNNQNVAFALQLGKYVPSTSAFEPVLRVSNPDALAALGLTEADTVLGHDPLEAHAKILTGEGHAFLNLSRVGKPPLLGVVLLDRKAGAGEAAGMAWALISLKSFQSGIPASVGSLAIFTEGGETLFHTDSSALIAASTSHEGDENSASDPIYKDARESHTNTGAREVVQAGTRYLASYYKPGLDLIVSTRTEYNKAMQATYTLTEKLLFFGVLSIALSIILAILFAKSLTRPVSRLYEATRQVSAGNFQVQLPVTSTDELGALSQAFGAMSKKIGELVRDMVDRVRIEQEVAVASTVQANLFPLPTYGDKQVRIKGYYQSASECGGDWWGFFRVGNRMCILIADATGHGIPSALMTAAIRGAFSAIHQMLRTHPDALSLTPRDIIPIANSAVFESGRAGINMTFFVGVIDFDEQKMVYANAAHCPPWLIQRQQGKPIKMRSLTSAGPRLGEAPEIGEVAQHEVKLQPNDLLLFYTDGLLENKSPSGVMYSKKRARKILEGAASRGEEGLINALVKDFMEHNGGSKALDDDLTLVAVAITPEAFTLGASQAPATSGSPTRPVIRPAGAGA